ncbi:hypothetical protein LUZ60_006794 [Juncus effusus]|nr:hypothetical protein LUZ60_006794 [Juncus effusus]
MADIRRYSVTPQLNLQQILQEAQNRWLRPVEICEILRNHEKFRIAPEPPNKPQSGSLFLFDRKVLRYFRKDNHNWRKKKDGKTVKEAHEKLKDGSVDVLHCYYAHGEDNESFQRRTYWLLEAEYTHIVLVHYLEVKGGKQTYSRLKETEVNTNNSASPLGSNSNNSLGTSSPFSEDQSPNNSEHTSEYHDNKLSDFHLGSNSSSATSAHRTGTAFRTGTGTAFRTGGTGHDSLPAMRHYDDASGPPLIHNNYSPFVDQRYNGEMNNNQLTTPPANSDYYTAPQVFDDGGNLGFGLTTITKTQSAELASWDEVLEQSFTNSTLYSDFTPHNSYAGPDTPSLSQLEDSDIGCLVRSSNNTAPAVIPSLEDHNLSLLKHQSGDLKKHDSFYRWMSKELNGAIDELSAKSSSDLYWSSVAGESNAVIGDSNVSITNNENLDSEILSPSVSQDQLFSIIDFSPCWAYIGSETKVLVTGTFLKRKEEVEKCDWSCMFGETEVPAQILSDGTLRCYAPPHKTGTVPFYVSCSNRVACSEIREFEFRETDSNKSDMETTSDPSNVNNSVNEMHLHIRLEKLLSLDHSNRIIKKTDPPLSTLCSNITSLLVDDDEWTDLLKATGGKDWLVQKLMKEKLHSWLIQKVTEEGKGPNVLGLEGQGVIHLVSALGFDWAVKPVVIAGVSVNFRDVHGWTALHWAASCGRERTVVALKTLGADPGALTDPTPEFPSGRTPADLASTNGHKGIAGFLAESSLTSHLSTLTLKDNKITNLPSNQQQSFNQFDDPSGQNGSMKDSLSAVRNATQAAARIYQVFRLQSFQRKKVLLDDDDDDVKGDISEQDALSLVRLKNVNKPAPNYTPLHAAAARIQNKFRGWKGRKEFLIIRQRIVKIQAHVRGHQVRKRYRKIVWTVGIVEKVILRWRRRGAGLRGFKSENLSVAESSNKPNENQNQNKKEEKEDDYDFLQDGRKQTEARLQRALARVKSMVQYPEARDQYRRLMNVVDELEVTKAEERMMSEDVEGDDFMVELEELGEDDIVINDT